MLNFEAFRRRIRVGFLALLGATLAALTPAVAETPDETFKALGLSKTATPKELYDALTKRYHDEAQGAGKGSLSKYWEPIPISKYLNPQSFYKPPQSVDVDATRLAVVERLIRGPAAVSELSAPFAMAGPSFLKHLKVLEDAGLVTRKPDTEYVALLD